MEQQEWDNYVEDYHDCIISPLRDDVRNPLYRDIERVGGKELVVADVGTGRGELLPFLAERFKTVHAVDFSAKMLEVAQESNKACANVRYHQADMRSLSALGLHFDCVVAVNSILQPKSEEVDSALREIFVCLNEGGIFFGIFPAMEATLYHFHLVYERELAQCSDEATALRRTRRIVERRKYNLITATFTENGESQKLYYKFELRNRLQNAGFKEIRFRQVRYPWGSGNFEPFPEKREMWDWFALARK